MARIERAEKLIKSFEATRRRIEEIILSEQAVGNPVAHYQLTLKRVDKEIQRLRKEIAKEIARLAREEHEKAVRRAAAIVGLNAAAVALLFAGERASAKATAIASAPAPKVMPPTIGEIIFDKQAESLNALASVGRHIRDVVRDLSIETVGGMMRNEIERDGAAKLLAERLLGADGSGLGGIEYRNGAVMPFEKYAQMVVRSTAREAANIGMIETAAFVGSGLIKLSSHAPTCAICAPRQGRVYRIMDFPEGDGRNAFPYIDKAFPGWPVYANIHPNCVHVAYALPAWDTIPEEERARYLSDAAKPFDLDPRSEAEIAAYNAEQAQKRSANLNRQQYVRYKAVLGDEMPSYQGWLSMKRANSERYQDLRADYRYALKIIKKESIIQTGHGDLPIRGDPGQIKDLVRPDGFILQRREYGQDGRALKDFDTTDHGNPKEHPNIPHAHDWDFDNEKPHGKERPLTEEEQRQNKDLYERSESGDE